MDMLTETIEEARRACRPLRPAAAAELLTTAAGECNDERRAAMIRSLAIQGRERSGRFGKRRWDEAIRLADEQLATAAP